MNDDMKTVISDLMRQKSIPSHFTAYSENHCIERTIMGYSQPNAVDLQNAAECDRGLSHKPNVEDYTVKITALKEQLWVTVSQIKMLLTNEKQPLSH